MAGNSRKVSVSWPFAPSVVRLNGDTGFLKLVAMLAMFCDHAGKMLFPQYPIMRIIGRLALPIYAYCLAVGCVYTRNPLNYLKRILFLALITQPIYAVSMNHTTRQMFAHSFVDEPVRAAMNFYLNSWVEEPSILVTLAIGLVIICALRDKHIVVALSMMILCWLIRDTFGYRMKDVVLMVLFYLFISHRWISLPVVLVFMLWWALGSGGYSLFGVSFSIQAFAILSLPLIYIRTNTGIRLPKWLFYGFYPAHLLLIFALNGFSV